ncbi:TetR/AcrR family transcriptional regulator [Cytobacillus sp. FSL K6-0129]|uniref:TetR/AcrR family transcriptional regulator n=1 Tax=Cytobacillus sp. FSL K6-0129 TaxID=2921421 RepID=UPI0030FA0153
MVRPAGQGEVTRKKIIDNATILFEQKGYTSTSIEDIRKFIGISKGNIYTHFSSKEELYFQALEESFKQWKVDILEEIKNLPSAKNKLYAIGKYYSDNVSYGLERTVPEFISTVGTDEFKIKARYLIQEEFDLFYGIINEGVKHNEFKLINIHDVTLALYSVFTNLSMTKYLLDSVDDLDKTYENVITIFLQGLAKN